MVVFLVAVLHVDVDNGGEPATVMRRKTALHEFHRLDGVAVEDGEKAKQMAGIVNRGLIEDDEVLVGTAAAHIDARGAFRGRLHTRQQQKRFEDVFFAE